MSQAFDRFVARAGKKRAALLLDDLRRSHITPVIDKWYLCLVALDMLRDCTESKVWEASFLAVNMHPNARIGVEEWLRKISGFVVAAEKFEDEVIDVAELLPRSWLTQPLSSRQRWMAMVKDSGPSWDVDMICALREDGMPLSLVANIFKLYHAVQRLDKQRFVTPTATPARKSPPDLAASRARKKSKMIYHLFKVSNSGMTPEQQFEHAVTVRNRLLGKKGTVVSPHLDVEVTEDNRKFLALSKDDLNMYRVLQESTCKTTMRRKVAKRALTALGGFSGIAGQLNGPDQLKDIRAGLKFAESLEKFRHQSKMIKQKAEQLKAKKREEVKRKREARIAETRRRHKEMYNTVMKKLRLGNDAKVSKHHVDLLTGPQLKVRMLAHVTQVFLNTIVCNEVVDIVCCVSGCCPRTM